MSKIELSSLEMQDLELIRELQPPTWNDIVPRCRYMIGNPACLQLKAVMADQIVGIGSSLSHKDTAWLATIVVHPGYRNQGIGTLITSSLLSRLDRSVFTTVYLDATELGFPVYQKLGFIPEIKYQHFKGIANVSANSSEFIIPFEAQYQQEVLDLDKNISGECREQVLLEEIRSAVLYRRNKKILGAYFPALYEGLIIAANQEAGLALMGHRLSSRDNAALPETNLAGLEFLNQCGLIHFRTSNRMRLGLERPWQPGLLFNRISGQLG
jgi:GNAT superfamily N-acetyltransferase